MAGTSSCPPINEIFLANVCNGIEDKSRKSGIPSDYYTPSGMGCIRSMYYKRRKVVPDNSDIAYADISCADTGTRRHEAIQDVLIWMTEHNNRFMYIDVDNYVKQKQKRGKCIDLVVLGKSGAETSLLDKKRNIKFRCDGIIYDKIDKLFYLFEFKNQISFKASGKKEVDPAHYCQVNCYCAELDLDKALVTYENRDTGELYCPEVFKVSEYDKKLIMDKVDKCESFASKGTVPKRPTGLAAITCRYCDYKKTCKHDGSEGAE